MKNTSGRAGEDVERLFRDLISIFLVSLISVMRNQKW